MHSPNFLNAKTRRIISYSLIVGLGLSIGFFVYIFSQYLATSAATITWDGGGATNDWSEAANWSGDTLPGSGDIALFDGTSVKDATIDAGFAGTVAGVEIDAAYTGTITQARSLTVGADDFVQNGGTFTGGTDLITMNDDVSLNAGTFTSTSGTLDLKGGFTVANTFNHNNGTITFTSTSDELLDVDTTLDVFNVTINTDSRFDAVEIANTDTVIVNGNLELLEGGLTTPSFPDDGGTIRAVGTISPISVFEGGSAFIDVKCACAVTVSSRGMTGLILDDPAASFTNTGDVYYGNTVHIIQGTFNAGGGEVTIRDGDLLLEPTGTFNNDGGKIVLFPLTSAISSNTVSGDFTFHDLEFDEEVNATYQFETGFTYTIEGVLDHESSSRAGTFVTMSSDIDGTQVDFDFQGESNARDLIVKDINNIGVGTFNCLIRCIDEGNNDGNVNIDQYGVTIGPLSQIFSEEGGTSAQFTLRLDHEPLGPVSLTVVPSDATQIDAVPTLNFDASNFEDEQTVTIVANDEALDDGSQIIDLSFTLSSGADPTYDGIVVPSRQVEIIDNDTAVNTIDFDNVTDYTVEDLRDTGTDVITWFEHDFYGVGYLQTASGGSDVDITGTKIKSGCSIGIAGDDYTISSVLYDFDGYIRLSTEPNQDAFIGMEYLAPEGTVDYIRCAGDELSTGSLNTGFVEARRFPLSGAAFINMYYDPLNDVIWSLDESTNDLITTNATTGVQTPPVDVDILSTGSDAGGAVDPTRGYLWWVGYANDEIYVLDGATGDFAFGSEAASTFSVTDRPTTVLYDSFNDAIWIAGGGPSAGVTKLNAADGSVLATGALPVQNNFAIRGMTYDSSDDAIWIAIDDSFNLIKLNAADATAFDTDLATSTYPTNVTDNDIINRGEIYYDATSDQIYGTAANCDFPDLNREFTDFWFILDADDGSYVEDIRAANCMYQVFFDEANRQLWSLESFGGGITRLDLATKDVTTFNAHFTDLEAIAVDSDGHIWVNNSWEDDLSEFVLNGVPANDYHSVVTTDTSELDTTLETTLSSITVTEDLDGEEISYLLSFDDRRTFKEWGSWVAVASDDTLVHGGVDGDWYYLNGGAVWTPAVPNTQESAISLAVESGYGTSGTVLNSLSESDLTSAGGFEGGVTPSINMSATFFSSDVSNNPQVNGVEFNFTATSTSGGGGGGDSSIIPRIGEITAPSCVPSLEVPLVIEVTNAREFIVSDNADFIGAEWQEYNGEANELGFDELAYTYQAVNEGTSSLFFRFRSSTGNLSVIEEVDLSIDLANLCEEVEFPVAIGDGCDGIVQDPLTDSQLENYLTGISPTDRAFWPKDEIVPGDFVRGEEFTTVYCIAHDFSRRPFTDETTFFTHTRTLANVKWTSDLILADFPLMPPMLPKEGVTLLKFEEEAKVYIFEIIGEDRVFANLHWIETEELAQRMFGDDWSRYIIHINPKLVERFEVISTISEAFDIDLSRLRSRQLLNERNAEVSDIENLVIQLQGFIGRDRSVFNIPAEKYDWREEGIYTNLNEFNASKEPGVLP